MAVAPGTWGGRRTKMQKTDKLTELVNQATSAIMMLNPTDVSELEKLQAILDQIKQNVAGMTEGSLRTRQNGAYTIAQDEASSIVFGMPKEAIECGAAQKVVPLHQMAKAMIDAVHL